MANKTTTFQENFLKKFFPGESPESLVIFDSFRKENGTKFITVLIIDDNGESHCCCIKIKG